VPVTKPSKRKVPGSTGRVTPKGGVQRIRQTDTIDSTARTRPGASTRYTPPSPQKLGAGPSGRVIPVAVFGLLGTGLLMIIINYLGVLLPGATSNWYILGGLVLILSGIMVATQWR